MSCLQVVELAGASLGTGFSTSPRVPAITSYSASPCKSDCVGCISCTTHLGAPLRCWHADVCMHSDILSLNVCEFAKMSADPHLRASNMKLSK